MTVFLSFRNKRPNRGGLGKRPNVSKFVCATLPYPANLFLVVLVRRLFCIIVKPVRAPATDEASHHKAKHISTASKGHLVTIIIMMQMMMMIMIMMMRPNKMNIYAALNWPG